MSKNYTDFDFGPEVIHENSIYKVVKYTNGAYGVYIFRDGRVICLSRKNPKYDAVLVQMKLTGKIM